LEYPIAAPHSGGDTMTQKQTIVVTPQTQKSLRKFSIMNHLPRNFLKSTARFAIPIAFGICIQAGVVFGQSPKKPIEIAKIQRAANKPISYSTEISEILENKCTGCHNDALAENKLKMETLEQMLKGGKNGPALKPGKADESLMFQMGSHRLEPVMPPKDKKDLKPWTSEEAALIKMWIDQGAKDDSSGAPVDKPKPAIVLGALPAKFAPIYAIDMSPDERVLAVGRGAQLHLVEPVSGLILATLGGHQDAIQSVRFRPDSGEVASGSYRVVTRTNLPRVTLLKNHEKLTYEASSIIAEPNSATLWATSATEPKLRLIESATAKEIRQISWTGPIAKSVRRSAFEPLIAIVCADGTIRIHQSEKGELIQTLPAIKSAQYSSIVWLGKGRFAAGSNDGKIQIFEIKGPGKDGLKSVLQWNSKEKDAPVQDLITTADGKQVISLVKGKTLELSDLATGKLVKSFTLNDATITSVQAISTDGSIWIGQSTGKVARWSKDLSAKLAETTAYESPVIGIGTTNKGSRLVVAYQNGLTKVLNTADLATIWAWNASTALVPTVVQSMTVLSDDTILTGSKEKSIKAWKFDGSLAAKPSLSGHADRVLAIDYSPDGKRIATTGGEPSRSGEVKLWNVETGALEKSLDSLHSDTVFGIRFSPDGKFLATCAADKFAKVTQLSDFKTLRPLEGHTNHVLGLDWKADGKQIVTAGADQALKLWNVETGEQVRTAQSAGKQITGVRWSATKPVITGSSGDKNVRLWNPENGQISKTLGGANDFLFSVATNKDATLIYSGGQNGVVHIWNAADGKLIKTLEFAPKTAGVAIRTP